MPPDLLAPGFTLLDGDRAPSGATLLAQGRARAEAVSGALTLSIDREGVAGLITAMIACAVRGADLYVLRDAGAAPPPAPATHAGGAIWLQTSGTTGTPKWVAHRLDHLAARVAPGKGERARWLLSFNPGSFAGLQVLLSAMRGGHDLVAAPSAGIADLATLAVTRQVTHLSGTPTFWRAFLMALRGRALPLRSVTLGGEAADQPLLDALSAAFPDAHLRHIYATTEAGVIFSVSDGQAGFPRAWLDHGVDGVRLALSPHETLLVASPHASELAGTKFWDTKDVVVIDGDRVRFKGRLDAMVNVGGIKVYPEEVEAFILRLPFVQEARVAPKPNPITGHILTGEVILKPGAVDAPERLLRAHLEALPRAWRPASVKIVETLTIGATGKKARGA